MTTEKQLDSIIAAAISEVKREKRWSDDELARRLGVCVSGIRNARSGRRLSGIRALTAIRILEMNGYELKKKKSV